MKNGTYAVVRRWFSSNRYEDPKEMFIDTSKYMITEKSNSYRLVKRNGGRGKRCELIIWK